MSDNVLLRVDWEPDDAGEMPSAFASVPADVCNAYDGDPDDDCVSDWLTDNFGYLVRGWEAA